MKSRHEPGSTPNDRICVDVSEAVPGSPDLEQQMTQCGLSDETRRFVRNLHSAEKHLNDAFELVHGEGADRQRQQQVSQLYRELFGSD